MNGARDYHKYKHELGKIGPSHLISEHVDLSCLLCFFEAVLSTEHSGKVSKLISEESP